MTAMKSISKFISLALLIAAATACNTKEIDKPDIPDQPQISGNVRFTASMKQTRVEYSVNGDALHQRWEVDDVIYGFYGDNPVRKVTLKVTEVDEDTEYATLEATVAEEGAAFIAALKEKGKYLEVGLLYTGRNNESVYNNTIYASMQNQSTGKIPAYLVGNLDKIVKDEESGDTFVYFDFENECAILEIQSLTGIKETIDLESIEISGVEIITSFEYSGGSFGISTTSPTSVKVSGQLKADSNGNIVDADGNISCIRIAVSATPFYKDTSTEITVTAIANDASSTEYSSSYKGVLHPGCYIICAKDVVAKTEDSFYFTTVNAAFSHAAELSKDVSGQYNTAETNIVTLVRDCGLAGVTKQQDGTYTSKINGETPISIDSYNVTFDLNGHTLTLDEDECINVSTGKTLIVKDSSVPSTGLIENYYTDIENECGDHLICNSGTVIIDGGQLKHYQDWSAVRNYEGAVLTVNGGELYSDSWRTIHDTGSTVIVNDGKVSSRTSSAIYSDGGNVTINGGFIESGNEEDIPKEFVMPDRPPITKTIEVCGGAVCTISGGIIYNKVNGPAVYCSTSESKSVLSVEWPTTNSNFPNTTTKYGPIICVAGVHASSTWGYDHTPICASDPSRENSAIIHISGGYLINCNGEAFYGGDNVATNFYNLDPDTFGGFYSNRVKFLRNGSTNVYTDLYNNGEGNPIRPMYKGISYPTYLATSQGENSSFYMPIIDKYTGALWLFSKK